MSEHAVVPKQISAPKPSDSAVIARKLQVVAHRYHWLNEAAQVAIESLRPTLKSKDEPSYDLQLIQSAVDVALSAGTAAVGVFLSGALAGGVGEIGSEFVKMMFEGGLNEGIAAGRALLPHASDAAVDEFIDAQKAAAIASYMAAQSDFLENKQQDIKTEEAAEALLTTCSDMNLKGAARKHYEATRDAWVSYLAQQKYGAVSERGRLGAGAVPKGRIRTNMSKQQVRDRANQVTPGSVPAQAPSMNKASAGTATGLLAVRAALPPIYLTHMEGTPTVDISILGGVNAAVRKQYEGKTLADINIPRAVECKVGGGPGQPDFEFTLDETGTPSHVTERQAPWLAARPVVGHPEKLATDPYVRAQEGLQLLVKELTIGTVRQDWES